MATKIKPTVGRVVHYHESPGDPGKEQAALIAYVHSDNCINLAVFDVNGLNYSRTSVPLVQDGEPIPTAGGFATWMPYQVGQAAKTEQLEKELAKGVTIPGAEEGRPVPGDPAPAESEASGAGDSAA